MSCIFTGCTAADVRELTLEHTGDTGRRTRFQVHVCPDHADHMEALVDQGTAPNFDLEDPRLTTQADWLEAGRLARRLFGDEARPAMVTLEPGDNLCLYIQVDGETKWSMLTPADKGVFGRQDSARRLIGALAALGA
jgi:hypothetical protein